MLRVGLTGNIGSGKSAVASVFSILGIPIFHADDESRKHLGDPLVIEKIGTLFGQEVIDEGRIINSRLASVVFTDSVQLAKLNALMHPLVMSDFEAWSGLHAGAPYLVMEAAILFESGYEKEFDRIIHVSCPEEIAVERVVRRDRVEPDQVKLRMQRQIKNDDKAGMADFVIINDGSRLLIPQILAVHRQILEICS